MRKTRKPDLMSANTPPPLLVDEFIR
jgi:hypothetical protein